MPARSACVGTHGARLARPLQLLSPARRFSPSHSTGALDLDDVAALLNALRASKPGPDLRPVQLTSAERTKLKTEHSELVLGQVTSRADRVVGLPGGIAAVELGQLNQALRQQLLAHEIYDDADLYLEVTQWLDGRHPLAALIGGHREIS